jgi:hypothetical protein
LYLHFATYEVARYGQAFLPSLKRHGDSCQGIETLIYQDEKETKIFTKEFWGTFSDTPKGSGLSIEQVAEFNGSTIGERRDMGKLSHDPKDYIWIELAKWFGDYK